MNILEILILEQQGHKFKMLSPCPVCGAIGLRCDCEACTKLLNAMGDAKDYSVCPKCKTILKISGTSYTVISEDELIALPAAVIQGIGKRFNDTEERFKFNG